MNKEMTSIQLINVIISGFKIFDKTYIFEFEKGLNKFIGANRIGKSSIADAIAWTFTGKKSDGDTKNISIINKNSKLATVSIHFSDQNGKSHTLVRRIASATVLTLDDTKITQEKLNEKIDTNAFLLIFNPLYFIGFDTSLARNTVTSYLDSITKDKVFSEMNSMESLFLKGETFSENDTNGYLLSMKKELQTVEGDIIKIDGYVEKLNDSIKDVTIPCPIIFDKTHINNIQIKIDEINMRKPNIKSINDSLVKKAELEGRLNLTRVEKFSKTLVMIGLQNDKKFTKLQIETADTEVYKLSDINLLKNKIEDVKSKYRMVEQERNTISQTIKILNDKKDNFKTGDVCPTCKHAISNQNLEEINTELKKIDDNKKTLLTNEYKDKIAVLVTLKDSGVDFLKQIEEMQIQDLEKSKEHEKVKAEKIKYFSNQISNIDKELELLSKEELVFIDLNNQTIKFIEEEISNLGIDQINSENAKIMNDFDIANLNEKIELKRQLDELNVQNSEFVKNEELIKLLNETLTKNIKELESKNNKKIELEKIVKDKKFAIQCMKNFNAKKMAVINSEISTYLNDVEIKIQKLVESTAEIKDCFEVFYCGNELKICSTSETIKAGLEISNLFSKLTGYDFPLFIDNAESITDYEKMASQIIEVTVVANKVLSAVKAGIEIKVKEIEKPTKVKSIKHLLSA